MKINGKQELLARTARRGPLLAAFLGMVLSVASVCRAQASMPVGPAQDAKPTATRASTTQASAAIPKPVTLAANAPASTEEKPPAKGQREGITVHGHWTIEVRDPDGRVATHREFENSFVDSDVLAKLLVHASTAGGLSITLLGTCGTITYPNYLSSTPIPPGGTYTGPGCVLYESDSPAFTAPFYTGNLLNRTQVPNFLGTNSFGYGVDCGNGNPNCYGVLSASYVPGVAVITLQGTAQLPATAGVGSISAVYANIYTCAPSNSPSDCANDQYAPTGVFSGSFTLTGTTLPSSVPVSGGQSVSVTVQISFSSK